MARFTAGDTFHNRYRLEALIGMGGFAEVWKATDTIADTVHAIKIFAPDKGLNSNGIELFKKDYKLTAGLRHASLLTATHFDICEESPYLVMPLCEKGSLENQLRQGLFSEDEISKVIEQVASGLAYMHALNPPLVHRDIKTDNVLLADDGSYLITDFGISSQTRNSLRKATSAQSQLAISVSYAPPERFQSPPISLPAGDVFSLGVMVYELCVGDVPWEGNGGLMLTKGAAVPQLPPAYSKRLNAIIQACMCPEHSLRPTAIELIEWAKTYRKEQTWPVLPESYAMAIPAHENQEVKSSNRKTQRMEDIQLPQQAAIEQIPSKQEAQKEKNDAKSRGDARSDDKPSGGMGIGKIIGLVVAGLIVFLIGLPFLFDNEPTNPVDAKTGTATALEMLNESSKPNSDTLVNNTTTTENTPVSVKEAIQENKPVESITNTKKGSSESLIKKKLASTTNYAPSGSLSAALARLGQQGLSYQEKLALKKEMMSFFASNQSVVITQVGGLVENAEEARDFTSRIITLPAPKIKIVNTESTGNKISKLVIEVD